MSSSGALKSGPTLSTSGRKVSPLLGIMLVPTGLMSGSRDATHCSIPCIYPKDVLRYTAQSWSAYAYSRRKEPHVLLWRTTACNVCIPLLLSEVWSLHSCTISSPDPLLSSREEPQWSYVCSETFSCMEVWQQQQLSYEPLGSRGMLHGIKVLLNPILCITGNFYIHRSFQIPITQESLH